MTAFESDLHPLFQLRSVTPFPIDVAIVFFKIMYDLRRVLFVHEDEIDLLKRLAAGLRAHEIDEDACKDTASELLTLYVSSLVDEVYLDRAGLTQNQMAQLVR